MITVLIAGGLGTRLWPLSTEARPKQVVELIEGQDALIKQMYDHLEPASKQIFIVASPQLLPLIKESLPNFDAKYFVAEPAQRGTANAIFLALVRILKDYPANQPLFFAWADQLIGNPERYRHLLVTAQEAIQKGLGLIKFGIKPSYPATGFGYIRVGQLLAGSTNIFNLEEFKEKPDEQTAREFIKQGDYLWNAGYFMTTAQHLQTELTAVNPPAAARLNKLIATPEDKLEQTYLALEPATIEKELSERLRQAYVIACDFDWADLGSFKDLHAHSQLDEASNYLAGKVKIMDIKDSYVVNRTSIPVACVGLNNLAIVVTKDGILVADKNKAAEIGEIAKQIQTDEAA